MSELRWRIRKDTRRIMQLVWDAHNAGDHASQDRIFQEELEKFEPMYRLHVSNDIMRFCCADGQITRHTWRNHRPDLQLDHFLRGTLQRNAGEKTPASEGA